MVMVLDAFVSQFSEMLANVVKEEVVMLLGVKGDIKKLKRRLEKINVVLEDVERMEIQNQSINNNWLKELKDVMYDADDVIDECRIEGRRHSRQLREGAPAPGSSSSSDWTSQLVCCFAPLFSRCRRIPFYHEIGFKIKSIDARLEKNSRDTKDFHLKPTTTTTKDFYLKPTAATTTSTTEARSKGEWVKVLQNWAWSLAKQLEDLPSPLKQCFLYCSLFPSGDTLSRSYLTELWVSEGFARAQGGLSALEVAETYHWNLIKGDLLLPSPDFYYDGGSVMPDVLRELALFLVGDENYVGDIRGLEGRISTGSVPCRRACIHDAEATTIPDSIVVHKNDDNQRERLRALIFTLHPPIQRVPELLFVKVSRLRVLDLARTGIQCLPASVGYLVHLRYLRMDGTPVAELPETIGNLSNLKFLRLRYCENLRSLPTSLANLHDLIVLDIRDTAVDRMPRGMGGLERLEQVYSFVVAGSGRPEEEGGDSCSSTLQELKNLSDIKFLQINKLERVSSGAEARGAGLIGKPRLKDLRLEWQSRPLGDAKRVEDEEVLEELCPPRCVDILNIRGFSGGEFPSWLMTSPPPSSRGTTAHHLPNLKRLDLVGCDHCRRLPPVGQLPQLYHLVIESASSITTVGPELFFFSRDGGGSSLPARRPFPKLNSLLFKHMHNWEEWNGVEDGALPRLKTLALLGCPKLRSLPEGLQQATALTVLYIVEADSLTAIENLPCVKRLKLVGCPRLERVSNLRAIETLEVSVCPSLWNMENSLGALRHLDLFLIREEEHHLPEWFGRMKISSELQTLRITCSVQLLRTLMPTAAAAAVADEGGVGVAEWQNIIRHIPNVYAQDYKSKYYVSHTGEVPGSGGFNTNLPMETTTTAATSATIPEDQEAGSSTTVIV